MIPKVAVVDHGTGNLFSVGRALEHVGAVPEFVSTPDAIASADRLILPGVGAFGNAMAALRRLELIEPLRAFVQEKERPLLGICLGMQMLFDTSDEMGCHRGIGLISGKVRRIPDQTADGMPLKVPHIGWNGLLMPRGRRNWSGSVLDGIDPGEAVYLVHSYAGEPDDPQDDLADCSYGGQRICIAVQRGPAIGCQFHPELSGPIGLAILRLFVSR